MHKIDKRFDNLQEAGFDAKESAVYLATLQIGKGTVMQISQGAKVDRTTTYRILQQLLTIPLVQSFREDKKTYWAALNPRYLVDYLARKKRIVQELFPELEALYNLNEEKPRLAYFEGVDGLAQLTAGIIQEVKARGEIISFSAPGAASGYYSTKQFLVLAQARAKKQIMSRILIPTIEGVPGYREGEDFAAWRHIKIVPKDKFPFKATINIWNNKVSIMTVRSHPMGVVLESKDISDTFRSLFEMVWLSI